MYVYLFLYLFIFVFIYYLNKYQELKFKLRIIWIEKKALTKTKALCLSLNERHMQKLPYSSFTPKKRLRSA